MAVSPFRRRLSFTSERLAEFPPPAPSQPGTPEKPSPPHSRRDITPLVDTAGVSAAVSIFDLNIQDASETHYFDPALGSEYVIGLSGLGLRGFVIPDYDGTVDVFTLLIGDLTFIVSEGQHFDVSTLGLSSFVDGLALRGVTPDFDHFVIGLDFDRTGAGMLGIIEIARGVPEPRALTFLAIGFLCLGAFRFHHKLSTIRCRRTHVFGF